MEGEAGSEGEGREPREPAERPVLARLDPDRAARVATEDGGEPGPAGAPEPGPAGAPELEPEPGSRPVPAVDTRRYRWTIGVIGLALVIAISVYQFATHGVGSTPGVAPGHRLHLFAAPLAASNLDGDPNAHPYCTQARHDPRALNLCLMAARGPLVLALFVTGARPCLRSVDALQELAPRFAGVQFAAVAVSAGHAAAAAAVRAHRWTIPVAYDRDGAVQALYGVVACPMIEFAARGGVVRTRLIGDRWQTAAVLAPYVRALAPAPG